MKFLAGQRAMAVVATAVACVVGATTAASAESAGRQQAFGAAVGTAADQAAARLAPAEGELLRAGQVGTRSQVPWQRIGSGWTLAEFTTGTYQAPRPVTLYLIDPAGGKYRLHQWAATRQPWRLVDWSGDRKRALFQQTTGRRPKLHQLVLATGTVTTFDVPAGANVLGYTRPDGDNVLVADHGIVRYSLTGQRERRLIAGHFFTAMSSANGQTELVNSPTGVALVSNAGGLIRRLPVPGASAQVGGCLPVRWWKASVALVSCISAAAKTSGPRLWLVPVSGAAPAALRPRRHDQGLGELDAWRLRSGLYVQALDGCGGVAIGKQAGDGKVSVVNVPGSDGNNVVVATSGNRMLVHEFDGCLGKSSLAWFNPATGKAHSVLRGPAKAEGVIYAVAFDRNGDEPSDLP